MKIWITYEIPTARGNWSANTMTADTFDEAEEICEAVERNGYRLLDVTRDVYDD